MNKDKLEDYDAQIIYNFLDFHYRVQKRTGAPYVRDMVTIDYLTDSLNKSYETAEKIMDILLDQGILGYDSHGAFPGSILTEKGAIYLVSLRKQLGITSEEEKKPSLPSEKTPLRMHIWGKTQNRLQTEKLEEI